MNTVDVQQQLGFDDCDLFSIAFAFEFGNGPNPAFLCFYRSKMSSHFNNSVKNHNIPNLYI